MILDGKKIAAHMYEELAEKIQKLEKKPKLAAILVGNNMPSLRYIAQKRKFSEKIGMQFSLFHFPEDISQKELEESIFSLNADPDISAYIVQLPLPKHIQEKEILEKIDPRKDADGFHPINQGKVLIGDNSGLTACTPAGVMKIFDFYNISLPGKKICIIGRSNIVGKPLALLCINAGATVTSCNSHTKNLTEHTQHADIVICAAGKAKLLSADMVQENCIIIDVGFSFIDGKIYGDADFSSLNTPERMITPVPGGVGPLTVSHLLFNTLKAHENQTL